MCRGWSVGIHCFHIFSLDFLQHLIEFPSHMVTNTVAAQRLVSYPGYEEEGSRKTEYYKFAVTLVPLSMCLISRVASTIRRMYSCWLFELFSISQRSLVPRLASWEPGNEALHYSHLHTVTVQQLYTPPVQTHNLVHVLHKQQLFPPASFMHHNAFYYSIHI